jgi:hypothetical protein
MASSGILRRVALVRTEVTEALSSSETSVVTRATLLNIQEEAILHSHRRENLKSSKDAMFTGVFVAAGTCLPVRCLATIIGIDIETNTEHGGPCSMSASISTHGKQAKIRKPHYSDYKPAVGIT